MKQVKDVGETQFLRLESQHPFHRWAVVPETALVIDHRDNVERIFNESAKLLLTLMQRRFRFDPRPPLIPFAHRPLNRGEHPLRPVLQDVIGRSRTKRFNRCLLANSPGKTNKWKVRTS